MNPPPPGDYVHGYSDREAQRLADQAGSVQSLVHHDTRFEAGERVLEVACGVGAQTATIAMPHPETVIVSFDLALGSLRRARARLHARPLPNVRLLAADLFALPFPDGSFHHAFVSYVLEHMPDPLRALRAVSEMLHPGGAVTVVEGDHGSCYFTPRHRAAERAWRCLIEVQESLGGDALIGRRLYPILAEAGFEEIRVSPRVVYADASRPEMMDRFVAKTIVPMVEGVERRAIGAGLISEADWRAGLRHLRSIATLPDGAFCYTFFKAVARKPA